MEKIISFISEHYQTVILAAACVLDLILFLAGLLKKKTKAPLDVVLTAAPVYIKLAESIIGEGKGDDKKAFVMKYLVKTYKNLTGLELSPGSVVYSDIDKFVEKILETPTKKGK